MKYLQQKPNAQIQIPHDDHQPCIVKANKIDCAAQFVY